MSMFFVGQKVRMVRPDSGSIERGLVRGDEGHISEVGGATDFRVTIQGKVNPRTGTSCFPVFADEIEPILDQHQPCETECKESLDRLLEREVVL